MQVVEHGISDAIRYPFVGWIRKISVLRRVRLMCMAVTRRGQGAVQGALSIASQYPSQRVP